MAAKAEAYSIDLTGAKIIDGKLCPALDGMVMNSDCSMNQVGIYGGKLLFSEQGLQDAKMGNIRMVAKNDPWFGSQGNILPNGEVDIDGSGFYRGLSFLLRGKGNRLIVSQENIDREKDLIGRYWQVLLVVKLLPMQNEAAQYQTVGNWHELARQMGATESANPQDFLAELNEAYPDSYAGKMRVFDAHAQARWLIGKLVKQAVLRLYEPETFTPPETYTPANIVRPSSHAPYDYEAFMHAARSVR